MTTHDDRATFVFYSTPLNQKRYLMNKTKDQLSTEILRLQNAISNENKLAARSTLTDADYNDLAQLSATLTHMVDILATFAKTANDTVERLKARRG